jgi:3-deoxy-D-manno-octulosonate cytidylyltransferase
MKVVAMIPARLEASRFPGKLMKQLGSKTIIRTTYEAAESTDLFDEVYVVTDSKEIFEEIKGFGGNVIMSREEHHSGSDRIAEAVTGMDVDIVINVQGDEPFIKTKSLQNLIEVFKKDADKKIDIASLMIKMDDPDEIQNPNNVKVVCDENLMALYFSRAPIPFSRSNEATDCYRHIGIYAFRKDALIRFTSLKMSKLEKIEKLENLRFLSNGMTVKMVETDEMSIGIDTPNDLDKANAYLKGLS